MFIKAGGSRLRRALSSARRTRSSPARGRPRFRALGAFLLLGAALNAQTTYRDPDGLYTVQAPAGWTITKDPASGQVAFKNGAVSATLAITQTKDWPKDIQEVQDIDEKEMQGDRKS